MPEEKKNQEELLIDTDPTMTVNGVQYNTNVEAQIFGYQNYDIAQEKRIQKQIDEAKDELVFLRNINAENGPIANKKAYEIVRNGLMAERTREISLLFLTKRVDLACKDDTDLIRKQRCILFYGEEIIPLRKKLARLKNEYEQIQTQIKAAYDAWDKAKDDADKRQEQEDIGKGLSNDSNTLAQQIDEVERELEEKRKELVEKKKTSHSEIIDSLEKKVKEIKKGKEKEEDKASKNVLSFISPDIPFERIDTISALIAKYSQIEEEIHNVKVSISTKEQDEISKNNLFAPLKKFFGNNIEHAENDSNSWGILITEESVDELDSIKSKYKKAFNVLEKLMNSEALELFYSNDSVTQAKTSSAKEKEFGTMLTAYELLRDETIGDDEEIEELFDSYYNLRNQKIKDSKIPNWARPVCQKSIKKHNDEYQKQIEALNSKLDDYINKLLSRLNIPNLNDWIRKLKEGVHDDELKKQVIEDANWKLQVYVSLTNRAYSERRAEIEPRRKKQAEIKADILKEIGLSPSYVAYNGDEFSVPIIEDYTNKASILRTIAAAQKVPEINESEIGQQVKEEREKEFRNYEKVRGQIDSDYDKTVQFAQQEPRFRF